MVECCWGKARDGFTVGGGEGGVDDGGGAIGGGEAIIYLGVRGFVRGPGDRGSCGGDGSCRNTGDYRSSGVWGRRGTASVIVDVRDFGRGQDSIVHA